MREDKRITQEDIDEAEVRLKPFLGLPPGKWLAALLSLALILALFLILVFPGLRRNGSLVHFDSLPRGAAVRVDEAYVGSTPCEAFVLAGTRHIRISRPFFVPFDESTKIQGRVFASLIAPKQLRLEPRLAPIEPESLALLHDAYSEYAAWALTGKPTATYQVPLVLSESLLALAEAGASGALPREKVPVLAARAFAAAPGEHAARDAVRATFLAAAGGAPSPIGLVAGLESLIAAEGDNPAVLSYLEAILPPASRAKLIASGEYANIKRKTETAEVAIAANPRRLSMSIEGIRFISVPAGSFVMKGIMPDGTALPYKVEVKSSWLGATETTRGMYARFLAENPGWRPENRAALIADGSVDDRYLADWDDPSLSPSLPVSGVSWKAAAAYCEWLTKKAPAGYMVLLPSEALWEYAAFLGGAFAPDSPKGVLYTNSRTAPEAVGSQGFDKMGLADLCGNLWEWCEDDYLAAPCLDSTTGEYPEFQGPEKSVRGGSWANAAESVSIGTRASFEASHATSFLGFRPALVERR